MSDDRDDELVTAWMQELAALPIDAPPLPDAAYCGGRGSSSANGMQRTVVAPSNGESAPRSRPAWRRSRAALTSPQLPAIATGVLVVTAGRPAGGVNR
jgi:hypothetical protein